MSDSLFHVSAVAESPARIAVNARNFRFLIDEPPELGGEDRGANPVEYLLAALLGCLNVTGQIVARELGIEFRSLRFSATGRLNPARLQGKPTDDRAGFKRIRVEVELDSDADSETIARWIDEVKSRCPISDNLGAETPVDLHARLVQPQGA